MSVYYKFKTDLASSEICAIKCNGNYISVDDLKRRIYAQRGFAKDSDFDLRFQNAQTKQVYAAKNEIIPKFTSLIVDRVDKRRSAGDQVANFANLLSVRSPAPKIPSAATTGGIRSPDISFKIAILGNLKTGKSSILHRFADDSFDENCRATVGCDLRMKTVEVANKRIDLRLWDTAGQERYRNSIVGTYLRNADGIILCYDVTCLDSLASIHEWFEFASKYAPEQAKKIMVGNKLDLWNSNLRQVEHDFVSNVSHSLAVPNLYCSAKDAENVEGVFRTITAQMLESQMEPITGMNISKDQRTFQLTSLQLTSITKKKKKDQCCE